MKTWGSLPRSVIQTLEKLRSTVRDDLLDPDTWRGVWYVVNYMVDSQAGFMKRRMRGDYDVDEWGYDEEWVNEIKPFFDFLYFRYWRVQVSGLENIPEEGRALLAANHSGQIPWDGAMVAAAVMNEHPAQRLVRTLYASWFPTVPFLSTLMVKMGNTLANEENGIRLLEQEQLVAVYPEGVKGVSKLYKDRYRLARFGRGGFVQMAIRTQSPIIPVSVVGAEETYISLYNSDTIAKLFGLPSSRLRSPGHGWVCSDSSRCPPAGRSISVHRSLWMNTSRRMPIILWSSRRLATRCAISSNRWCINA